MKVEAKKAQEDDAKNLADFEKEVKEEKQRQEQ